MIRLRPLLLIAPLLLAAATPAVAQPDSRAFRIAAFVTAGRFSATAKDSFEAILDTTSATEIGGGAQIAWTSGKLRGIFIEVDGSRVEETGERAFVHQGEVFRLGIPLTIGLKPLEVTGGYRLNRVRRTRGGGGASPLAYFAGGGIGSLGYREIDDDGVLAERFTSYHVMGGADVTLLRHLLIGGEARYRWVPDALGLGGVSEAFNETDLGGPSFRVRIGVTF
jgi:hypothetical protein